MCRVTRRHYCFFSFVCRVISLLESGDVAPPLRQVLVSKVVGATLGQPNGSIHLNGTKVEIILSTLNLDLYEVNQSSAICAYWNVSTQEWSFDGCELVGINGKITRPATGQNISCS